MNKRKVKSQDDKIYEENDFEVERSLEAREKRKKPTSVALDEGTIHELKKLAEKKGIPYQVLMRSFILEGLEKHR